MLDIKIKQLTDEQVAHLLTEAISWSASKYGESSVVLNKLNHTKKHGTFRQYIQKYPLKCLWARKTKSLDWYYYGQFAEYDYWTNTIKILCLKHYSVGFVLDSLFHEYKHSQQSMRLYNYHSDVLKVSYEKNPFEKEANAFAEENIGLFCKYYEKEFGSLK